MTYNVFGGTLNPAQSYSPNLCACCLWPWLGSPLAAL